MIAAFEDDCSANDLTQQYNYAALASRIRENHTLVWQKEIVSPDITRLLDKLEVAA